MLVIDQTAIVDFVLKPATLAETITVTGESPLVDTTASTVATSVSNEQIQDLPVASRRWIDLAMLTPGVSQDNIRGQFYRGNINIGAGTREYSNGFVVDGVNNTWAQMGEPRQNFAMDSIREFKVSQSTYKAEYGLATGGVLTVVTKSGTNQMHGSAFNFFRDKSLTAKTVFEAERPDFRRWQYGGTFGGPIVQNRTHFFGAVEYTDENQFFTVNAGGRFPQYEGTFPSNQYRWTYTGKVDHQISPSQNLFFRVSQEVEYRPIITSGGRIHPTNSFDFGVPRDSYVAGHTWIMSPRVINEVRVQYAYAKYEVSPPYSHGSWEPGYFGDDRLDYCTAVFNYPSLALGGCGNSQMGPEKRWEFRDDLGWTVEMGGFHQFKTGVDVSLISFRGDNLGSPLGSWTFPRDAEYDVERSHDVSDAVDSSLPTFAEIPVKHVATYIQDDWQVARRVTLNLGLRYDIQFGSYNRDLDGSARAHRRPAGAAVRHLSAADSVPAGRRCTRRCATTSVRASAWPGTSPATAAPTRTPATDCSTRTCGRCRTSASSPGRRAARSSSAIPSFPDALQGRSRDQFVSTAPPNITVMDNDTVSAYAHQFSTGVSRMVGTEHGHHRGPDLGAAQGRPRHRGSESARSGHAGAALSAVRARQLLAVDRRQQLSRAAAEVRAAVQRPLSVPGVLHAEQERGRELPERLRRSLRLLQGAVSGPGRSPPPSRGERHRADARRHPALGDRRFPLEPADEPDEQHRSQRRRLHDRSAGRRHALQRLPRSQSRPRSTRSARAATCRRSAT